MQSLCYSKGQGHFDSKEVLATKKPEHHQIDHHSLMIVLFGLVPQFYP
jgi:hypothetical protein